MRYVILIHADEATGALFGAMSPEQQQAAFQVYWDVQAELEASGELVDSEAIEPSVQRLVRRTPEGVVVTDAPAPEQVAAVSGYYVVDVVDEARAIAIGARFPEAEAEGGIRVVRVWTAEDFAALGS